MSFHTPGSGVAAESIARGFVTGLPNTDTGNVVVPLVQARIAGYNTLTGRWLNVCLYDPANPDVPGTACAIWTRPVDFPDPIRIQLVDAVSGNTALFFAAAPDATESGVGVRVVPSGQMQAERSQSVVMDHYSRTTFGQVRVAEPYALFDGISTYGINPRQWGTDVATGGTVAYEGAAGTIALSVTADSGSRARLRTHTYFLYQSGKTMRPIMTVYHPDSGQMNQTRRWGYFEDNDGLFFELAGTSLRLVRRSSVSGVPVDTAIERANWNFDSLDGLGPSGMTLDLTKANIYEIDLQWLSAGAVRFFVDGHLIHIEEHQNQIAGPYMRTAQLPIQCEIVNTGASTASAFRMICAAAHVDGGQDPAAFPFSRARDPLVAIGTSYIPLISFRIKASFGGRQNRRLIIPERIFVSNDSGKARFRVILNPTSLTTPVWTDVNTLGSGVEYDISSTSMTHSVEQVILEDVLPTAEGRVEVGGNHFFTALGGHMRCPAFGGAGDVMTIAGRAKVATTEMAATAAWFELG